MPVTFDWESADILRVKYYGIINGEDAVDASLRMSSDARFDDLRGIIIDTLELTDNLASETHVQQLVAYSKVMARSNPRIRNALVINQDETTGALAALYSFLADELVWDIEMFHSIDNARVWITP